MPMQRYPAWNPAPARGGRDFCSRSGAQELAAMIQSVWLAQCGVAPRFELEKFSRNRGSDDIYVVRFPNIVGGLYVRPGGVQRQ